MAENMNFDFEAEIESSNLLSSTGHAVEPIDLPAEAMGQQPANYRKNFRKTVCTYWLRGLCMKGDACGFLHQFVSDRMPVCRNLLKYGECHDQDCPYKHSLDEIKECNMYKLGFCIYGPVCRYKHIKNPGPPPGPEEVEAAKPREHRNINVVVNQVNPGVAREEERALKRPRPFIGRERVGGSEWDRPFGCPPAAPPPTAVGPSGPQAAAPATGGGGGGGRFEGGHQGREAPPGARGARGGGWWGGDDGGAMDGLDPHSSVGMPPLTAPRPGPLPPMAGLIAPVMPAIMPGALQGPGMMGGGPPPGPMGPPGGRGGVVPPGPMGHFDAGLFAVMAGQVGPVHMSGRGGLPELPPQSSQGYFPRGPY